MAGESSKPVERRSRFESTLRETVGTGLDQGRGRHRGLVVAAPFQDLRALTGGCDLSHRVIVAADMTLMTGMT